MYRVSCLALLLALLWPLECCAANALFLPGDAYFSSAMKSPLPEASEPTSTVQLKYTSPTGLFCKCGYAGYFNLNVPVSMPCRTALNHVYGKITAERGTSSVPLLVYASDFEMEKYRLGMKYNENWHEETRRASPTNSHFIYDSATSVPLILEDWHHGPRVPALPLAGELPPIENWMGVKEPLQADAARSIFVLLEGEDVIPFTERTNRARYWTVDQAGQVRRYQLRSGPRKIPLGENGSFMEDSYAEWREEIPAD